MRVVKLPKIRVSADGISDSPPPSNDGGLEENPILPQRIVALLQRDIPLALFDIAIVAVAYLVPLILRFDGAVPAKYWNGFWLMLPVAILTYLFCNRLFGLYGQMWRYASVDEARRVVLAAGSSGVVLTVAQILLGQDRPMPLSVVLFGATLSFIGFGAVRFQSRLFGFRRRYEASQRKRVLVVGAGDAGAMILRDVCRNPSLGLDPVGLVDDDGKKVGRSLNGIPVLGPSSVIPSVVRRLDVDQVLLAIPSASSRTVRNIVALCEEAQVTLRVLPSVEEAVGGRVAASDIRDLRIEDLLGRQQVHTDLDAVAGILRGRRVMVTGAGGSIGSEIVRQALSFHPATLVLLDHDETHLHEVVNALDGDVRVNTVLADVRDRDRMLGVFIRHRPHVVFHAAAHKHVPVLEEHPEEALFTNIIGTANVTDAALIADIERFVFISTDKAINPCSVMGASKWFAEQVVRSSQNDRCTFCSVRFGNVLGSRGSVIPTFFNQISRGQPVTVTDPAMTRYFMSVQEAVQLVLQAAALSEGGEVFTLDMGEPVNILDLAKEVVRLSGLVPFKDVDIRIVGCRPGEKIAEDVVDLTEEPLPSAHPSILVSQPPAPDKPTLRRSLRQLEAIAGEGRTEELAGLIKLLSEASRAPVPEEVRL